jgi:hypothetical protein
VAGSGGERTRGRRRVPNPPTRIRAADPISFVPKELLMSEDLPFIVDGKKTANQRVEWSVFSFPGLNQ